MDVQRGRHRGVSACPELSRPVMDVRVQGRQRTFTQAVNTKQLKRRKSAPLLRLYVTVIYGVAVP